MILKSNIAIFIKNLYKVNSIFKIMFYKFFFFLFENSEMLLDADPVFIFLSLKEKYSNIIDIDFDIVDILSQNFTTVERAIKRIEQLRGKIICKSGSVVKKMDGMARNEFRSLL